MQAYIKLGKLECRPGYVKRGSARSNAKAPITQNRSKTDAQEPGYASPINMENTPHQRVTDSIKAPIYSAITLATGRFRRRLQCQRELASECVEGAWEKKFRNIRQHDICICNAGMTKDCEMLTNRFLP